MSKFENLKMTLTSYLYSNFQWRRFINFQINQFSKFQINYGKFRYVGSVYPD